MKRIQLLDYGRFIAAISVMAFHYLFMGGHSGVITSISNTPEIVAFTKYGYLGVEFFFMISGYVIFFSAKNNDPGQFAVSRVTRLYPAFWAAVVFTCVFTLLWRGDDHSLYLTKILANLTMLPSVLGRGYVDPVYWTLFYELKFYMLVFLLLLIGARSKLEHLFLLWPIAIGIALYNKSEYFSYLSEPFCYFSAGAILAILKEKKTIYHYLSLLLVFIICISTATDAAVKLSEHRNIFYSTSTVAVIVSTFFVFFILANSNSGAALKLYGSRFLGGITYPIYLIHANFGYMFISRYGTEKNKIEIYVLAVFLIILFSSAIHIFIEKKYAQFWKAFFNHFVGRPISSLNSKFIALKLAYEKNS